MISKKKAILIGVILVFMTAFITTTFNLFLGEKVVITKGMYNKYKKYDKLLALESIIENDFYEDTNEQDLVDGAMKGLFSGTKDVYSTYYTKDEMTRLTEQNEGSYVGVGMYITANEQGQLVVIPMESSPAKKSGIKEGDILIKVGEEDVNAKNSDLAVSMIKGKEGTKVDLVVLREGKEKKITVERAKIVEHSVSHKVVDNNIGYIEIKQFIETTNTDFDKALKDLQSKNVKGLIID
ncbi:MAG: PDZ domain-containing protein [Clostridioides sp.]|jgi:carboxyl-terminal processing protease|nr:PDZ domain-containing protein [Clostridioides sp.]